MIGDWLNDDTPVPEVAAFAEKVFLQAGFRRIHRRPAICPKRLCAARCFPSCAVPSPAFTRGAWITPPTLADKERMAREADFAFRQAWALCPYSPEATYRYVNFLKSQNRAADAPHCGNDGEISFPAGLQCWANAKSG